MMRRRMVLMVMTVASLGLFACQGYGFFDELLKPQPKKEQPQSAEGQQESAPGLLDSLGGMLGAKQKELDLLKKGLGVVQALQPIGEEEERALGRAVAVEAFARFGGEYHNEPLTRYVNLVGHTVAEVSDRPELNFHFAILNSEEQNAFAAPGGYIFVTIGLLKALTNEAELAGVLAHEIAHVTKRHMLQTIQRGALLESVSELTLSAMNKDPQLFSNLINEMTDILFTKGLDKTFEYEADAVGVDYAYRAGYNPQGLRDYLATLQRQQGRVQSRFFTTHPPISIRIQKMTEVLAQFSDGQELPFLSQRFKEAMRSV
ncbi:MAG: hypothetical protein D6704_06205 [Nitrospirae bacterium]|nr:MAG: hypothetical protein D6704_06205 [Nitrospirota bacterium]